MSELFFLFYKAFSQLIMPLGLTLLFLLVALVLFLRNRKKSAVLIFVFTILWLWLWSTPVWSDFMRGRLESKFSYKTAEKYPEADAIVVLGGGVRGYAGASLPVLDLNRAADRELFAAQLYRAKKSRVIILSGGADPISRTGVAAVGMKVFLINLGIPSASILIGANSRNTVENVKEVVEMVKPFNGKSILLVTSALHMQRASWLFSRSGLKVIAAPTDFEVVRIPFSVYRLFPDAEALENSSRAAREFVGLAVHRLGFH
jgi:uncharacterized SAM-binding protein YcdF (DUF218 family)